MRGNQKFTDNLKSLAKTQADLAGVYYEWFHEGGKQNLEYLDTAERLTKESIKHAEMAEREMNDET